MGRLIGATFPIITRRIGEGGVKSGKEVKRINQLLRMAGFLKTDPASDLVWGNESARALIEVQKNLTQYGAPLPYLEPHGHASRYDVLALLALLAGVLIGLPSGLRSGSAFLNFYDHCRKKNYPYGWVAGDPNSIRKVWGFAGRPKWAIATTNDMFFAPHNPVALNCTSFTNLVLSLWMTGNAHSAPYDASQAVGGDDVISLRYNMKPINDGKFMIEGYCYDLPTIERLERDRLYHFASCYEETGGVKHDMILYNGEVYECNTGRTPAVFKTRVADKFNELIRARRSPRVLGPSPY